MSTTQPSSRYSEPSAETAGMMELGLIIAASVIFPPILLFGFIIVGPREEVVVLRFGKYLTTLRSEGIRWIHPVGRSLQRISTRDTTYNLTTETVVEKNGNPVLISAVVVYRVEDTIKAALHVTDYHRFLGDQGRGRSQAGQFALPLRIERSRHPVPQKRERNCQSGFCGRTAGCRKSSGNSRADGATQRSDLRSRNCSIDADASAGHGSDRCPQDDCRRGRRNC